MALSLSLILLLLFLSHIFDLSSRNIVDDAIFVAAWKTEMKKRKPHTHARTHTCTVSCLSKRKNWKDFLLSVHTAVLLRNIYISINMRRYVVVREPRTYLPRRGMSKRLLLKMCDRRSNARGSVHSSIAAVLLLFNTQLNYLWRRGSKNDVVFISYDSLSLSTMSHWITTTEDPLDTTPTDHPLNRSLSLDLYWYRRDAWPPSHRSVNSSDWSSSWSVDNRTDVDCHYLDQNPE